MKYACSILGILVGLAALLWCLAGAGLYGALLSIFHGCREFYFIVAFLLLGPLLFLLSAFLVWWNPARTSQLLMVGGTTSAVCLGRYTAMYPLTWLLMSIPLLMLLIGRTLACSTSADGTSTKKCFSTRHLLILSVIIAAAAAHGVVGRGPMMPLTESSRLVQQVRLQETLAGSSRVRLRVNSSASGYGQPARVEGSIDPSHPSAVADTWNQLLEDCNCQVVDHQRQPDGAMTWTYRCERMEGRIIVGAPSASISSGAAGAVAWQIDEFPPIRSWLEISWEK